MVKVKFYMKSGQVIEFQCEEIEIESDSNNQLVRYEATFGESKQRLIYGKITDIEGITVEDLV